MLKIDDMHVSYGNIRALKGVSLKVNKGEVVALLGANGAGKTTLMRTIIGLKNFDSGMILYDGEDIGKKDIRLRVKEGLVLSPEGRQIFSDFSVLDNLLSGGHLQSKTCNEEMLETVYNLFPILKEREQQYGGTLSGGEQQMLAVGRAVMSRPKLLLLDEPSLGLAPLIAKEIFDLVGKINKMGTTILIVEQNARAALRISDRAYILETGKIIAEGKSSELIESDEIVKAYLGGA